MASYILRKIDEELWRRFKTKAASEGVTIRALLEEMIRLYVDKGKIK